MRMALLVMLLAFIFDGCATKVNFQPKTAEGANCKAQCASDNTQCKDSSYTCDRAAYICLSACKDLDRIKDNSKLSPYAMLRVMPPLVILIQRQP